MMPVCHELHVTLSSFVLLTNKQGIKFIQCSILHVYTENNITKQRRRRKILEVFNNRNTIFNRFSFKFETKS